MTHRERGFEGGRWMELASLAFVLAVPAKKKSYFVSKIGMDAVKSKDGYKLVTLPHTVMP
jgi:hypothetical protein